MPKEPPVKDNVEVEPWHIEAGVADAVFAGKEEFTITVVLTQVVLLQSPTAAR